MLYHVVLIVAIGLINYEFIVVHLRASIERKNDVTVSSYKLYKAAFSLSRNNH
jgi:hypothetical protein